MDICSLDFFVSLLDAGENNEVSNKGILRIMQEAACVHSSYCGISVGSSKVNGLAWVILNWKLRVFSRPAWNSKLKVNTWVRNISHIFFYRDFEIFDEDNNLVAIATSKWVLFDFFNNSIAKITDDIKSNFAPVNKAVFDECLIEKLAVPKDVICTSNYTVLKRDIDTNHHVNNLNYLDFAYEALPKLVNSDFRNVEIMYKSQTKLGENLELLYSMQDNFHFVVIKSKDSNKFNCIVKLY